MPSWDDDPRWRVLRPVAQEQGGAVHRSQLLRAGLTDGWVEARLTTRAWVRLLPGVYGTDSSPTTALTRTWAAVLAAGAGATASHRTAAWLHRVVDEPPPLVHVTVPAQRRVVAPRGVVVHRSRHVAGRAHPVRRPPQLRLEEAVLDVVASATTADAVVSVVLQACQRRLTAPERLRAAATGRARLRWRGLLADLLADVEDGVHTELERRWARDVERAHGLPRGQRNVRELTSEGVRYRDVRYRGLRTVVELDGRQAHPEEERERDRRRDNLVAIAGDVTLRFGWRGVAGDPCGAAAVLVEALRRGGWIGTPHVCRRGCALRPAA